MAQSAVEGCLRFLLTGIWGFPRSCSVLQAWGEAEEGLTSTPGIDGKSRFLFQIVKICFQLQKLF